MIKLTHKAATMPVRVAVVVRARVKAKVRGVVPTTARVAAAVDVLLRAMAVLAVATVFSRAAVRVTKAINAVRDAPVRGAMTAIADARPAAVRSRIR